MTDHHSTNFLAIEFVGFYLANTDFGALRLDDCADVRGERLELGARRMELRAPGAVGRWIGGHGSAVRVARAHGESRELHGAGRRCGRSVAVIVLRVVLHFQRNEWYLTA